MYRSAYNKYVRNDRTEVLFTMNEKDAWENFVSSGSVSDYLRYASIKEQSELTTDANNEFQHRRTGDKRTEDKRGRQGNNNSYQG